MLDNLRRKLSIYKHKVFYDKAWDVGASENLVYYKGVAFSTSFTRYKKELIEKSFKYTYETSQDVLLNDTPFRMLLCPPGTFIMGHTDIKENPPRRDLIERPFLLGEAEVTQGLYNRVKDTTSTFGSIFRPQSNISWFDAILFCNKLSKQQGLQECYIVDIVATKGHDGSKPKKRKIAKVDWDKSANGYRLPTEKEWEYAAKAGTQNRWSGTDDEDELEDYAYFGQDSEDEILAENVKSLKPNEWGFYDMSGNVYEWCWDEENPASSSIDALRRVRGGSLFGQAEGLMSASREIEEPGERYEDVGFRLCRTIF